MAKPASKRKLPPTDKLVGPGHFFTSYDKTAARNARSWAWKSYKQGRINAQKLRTILAKANAILDSDDGQIHS